MELFFLLIASLHWDLSADGARYHKPAGFFLGMGWNPVWQENLEPFMQEKGYDPEECHLSHAWHFPKGQAINVGITY